MMPCQELRDHGSVVIVGAGPGGATLVRLLDQKGYSVRVLERDGSPTARSQGGSLDLRPDSVQLAVNEAGLGEDFKRRSRDDAKAFRMVSSDGVELPGMGEETHKNAGPEIDRGDLRAMLLDALPTGWRHGITRWNALSAERTEAGSCKSLASNPSWPIS